MQSLPGSISQHPTRVPPGGTRSSTARKNTSRGAFSLAPSSAPSGAGSKPSCDYCRPIQQSVAYIKREQKRYAKTGEVPKHA